MTNDSRFSRFSESIKITENQWINEMTEMPYNHLFSSWTIFSSISCSRFLRNAPQRNARNSENFSRDNDQNSIASRCADHSALKTAAFRKVWFQGIMVSFLTPKIAIFLNDNIWMTRIPLNFRLRPYNCPQRILH